MMLCPICKSDQTNSYPIKWNYYRVECANCDSETELWVELADMIEEGD